VIAAVQVDGKWSGEIRMLRKDGSIGWIESMCVPVYDEEQQIIGAIGVNRDITEKIHEKERLQHLAHFDHLTNLPNRYVVIDRIEHLIAQSNRDARKFALLFIDLDYFKALNDTNGHAFGDQALIQIASRLKSAIRSSDTAARFGGDEFVILLENISDRQDAINMVELLEQTLHTKYLIEGQKIHINSSIGIAVFPDDADTKNDLLHIADKAMYSTKLKNKVLVENPLNLKQ
jgi:diguanylate cyclase (GGDEF)-like protein